jgi:hypothetical protein
MSVPDTPAFRDQRTLLRTAGVLGILGALSCACLGGFYAVLFPVILPRLDSADPALAAVREQMPEEMSGLMLGSGIWLFLASGGLIWLFVGSLRIKRWARDLLHALGWLLAAVVAMTAASQAVFLPRMLSDPTLLTGGAPAALPPGTQTTILIVSQVVALGFYLAPSLALILVYGLKHVRLTVAHFDPKPSWTDGKSPWRLAWWLLLVTAASAALPSALSVDFLAAMWGEGSRPVILAGTLAGPLAWGALAWCVAKRPRTGWVLSLAGTVIGGAVSAAAVLRTDFAEAYRDLGMPDSQVRMMEVMYGDRGPILALVILGWGLVAALLAWRHRDFAPDTAVTR